MGTDRINQRARPFVQSAADYAKRFAQIESIEANDKVKKYVGLDHRRADSCTARYNCCIRCSFMMLMWLTSYGGCSLRSLTIDVADEAYIAIVLSVSYQARNSERTLVRVVSSVCSEPGIPIKRQCDVPGWAILSIQCCYEISRAQLASVIRNPPQYDVSRSLS